jgi:hypothetical protein
MVRHDRLAGVIRLLLHREINGMKITSVEDARIRKSIRISHSLGGRVERYMSAGQSFCAALYDSIIKEEEKTRANNRHNRRT